MKKLARKPEGKVGLGAELASGGEGRIHAIVERPGHVAKVYHQPPSAEKIAKLGAMVAARTDGLLAATAWPLELLRQKPGGPPIGVVMPRIDDHKDIHLLYGPRSRLAEFPLAGWPFLIRAAANLARAFSVVHAHGHVIGDVNDRVALVSQRAVVRLIDCDGYQIQHGGKRYACDVGVLTHQPPELQGVSSFRGLARSVNHDSFGLAVLVFQLLFLARHPFSGTYGRAGDMPLERAIKEHRFVYGARAAERGMRPPPAALDLSVVTRDVARLFEEAFAPEAARKGRPNAKRWAAALDELGRLVHRCRTNPSHAYLKGRSCPFCALDRQTELALFHLPLAGTPSQARPAVPIHLPSVWKEISAVAAPPTEPALPGGLVAFEQRCVADTRGRTRRRWTAALTVITALALALPTGGLSLVLVLLLPVAGPQRCRTPGGPALSARVRHLVQRWRDQASARAFHTRLDELKRAKRELEGLDDEHARALDGLDTKRRQHQLDAYLRKQRVADAELPALNRSGKAVLESYGIETAYDVSAASLSRVQALSDAARRALLAWRPEQEQRFVFDPSRGVDPETMASLERSVQKRRADLVQKLVDGPAALRHCAQTILSARTGIEREIAPLLKEIEKAEHDDR